MALKWFRKHQKVMLVVFGLAAIAAFTVGSIIMEYMGQGTRQGPVDNSKEVVLTWKFGDVTRDDLQRMRNQRTLALAFMSRVAATQGIPPQYQQFMGISNTTSTQSLVQTMLLGKKAEELGVEITDDAILQALDNFSNHSLSRADYKQILDDATQNSSNEYELFNALRAELKANEVQRILFSGASSVTPLEASQYYDWLHRKVNAEVAAIRVDSFVPEAGEPTDAQIQELYEEFRLNYPSPYSPDPGFNRRDRIRLEIVQAPRAAFIEAEKANVTDEEINNYYYTHLELFIQQPEEETPAEEAETPTETAEPSDGEEGASEETSSDESSEVESSLPESEAPAAEDGASTESAEEQPSSETAAQPEDADTSEAGDAAAEQGDVEIPAENGASEADSAPAGTDNAGEEAAGETSATDAAAGDADTEADQTAEATAEPVDTSRVTPIEYKPLEEVTDMIRNSIAAERAVTAMQDALTQVEVAMNQYREKYLDWDYAHQSDSELKQPPAPDLEALAQELNLTFLETELVDALELQADSLIGPALVGFVDNPYSPSNTTFMNLAFLPKTLLYSPMRAHLPEDAAFFVAWKTEEEEGTVPELSEIRTQVIDAWKQQKAVELATEKAQEIADRINESGGSLLENVQGYPVEETGTFGWMTWYGYGNPIVTREVPNIEQPGEEFFRAVYALKRNEVGVAVNQPHTFVYLVRITSENSPEFDRRQSFIAQGFSDDIRLVAQQQGMKYVYGLYEDLEKQYDLEWQVVLQPEDYE